MYTYQDLIRVYAKGVAGGTNDTDLTPQEKRLTEVLLNLASNAGVAQVVYPPTDDTRDRVVKRLGEILWDARALVFAAAPRSDAALSKATDRAIEALRSL